MSAGCCVACGIVAVPVYPPPPVTGIAHWAEIYGWPQRWVALNETTHPKGTKVPPVTLRIEACSKDPNDMPPCSCEDKMSAVRGDKVL